MYLTQTDIAHNSAMLNRVAAAAATEGAADAGVDPFTWAAEWALVWAAAPGWADAWDSAKASDIADPGRDESVITDTMILSQVQAMEPFTRLGEVA